MHLGYKMIWFINETLNCAATSLCDLLDQVYREYKHALGNCIEQHQRIDIIS